jgi:hypothetical protein
MILDIWLPKFKGSGKNRKIVFYTKYDIDNFLVKKPKGCIVRYTCDRCESKNIKNTTSSTLFRDGVIYNSIKYQTCRSCRSKISEYEIKKTQIPFLKILESFKDNNYLLITTNDEYQNSENKSQMKLKSICKNNHLYSCTWNNWSRGKRCRKCYDCNKTENSIKYKEGYELYHYLVWRETNKNYKNNIKILNPNNLKRNEKIHLDHIYSIYDGFMNNIPVFVISSIYNLRLISSSKNISKGKKSDISIDELFSYIFC